MSIIPLWPDLKPRATDPLWFNVDPPYDDENEVLALEAELQTWKEQTRTESYNYVPIGKSATEYQRSDEDEEEEDDEEGDDEEEEVSDAQEEEEELDDVDMEVSYTHRTQDSSLNTTGDGAPYVIDNLNIDSLPHF